MVDTLFFVHSDAAAADQLAGYYRAQGWQVESTRPTDPDALDSIVRTRPVALVFCLDSECAADVHGLAEQVVGDARISRPLMVFAGGSPDDIARARQNMPFGVFVRMDELAWVLKRLAVRS